MVNRSVAPPLTSPVLKGLSSPLKVTLANGIDCFYFNAGDQDIFKIELILSSGSSQIDNPAIATTSVEMLREGTCRYSGKTLHELLDYYGAFLDLKSGLDHSLITLYGRSADIEILVPVLSEILLAPEFDTEALVKQQDKAIQDLKINEAKTSYWSIRLLRKGLFGANHGYTRRVTENNIKHIDRNDLLNYHTDSIRTSMHSIIIAGSYHQKKMERLIEDGFSIVEPREQSCVALPNSGLTNILEKRITGASQASIALGKLTMHNRNSEYPKHALLIKVLGGYFGSRLMKTLREDEGLTYGIHAHTNHLKGGSYLQITSDIEHNSIDKGIKLIFDEMNKLASEAISIRELDTVKNYMYGEMINSANNVFDFAELYKKIILQGLSDDYYSTFYATLAEITEEDILAYAQQILLPNSFAIAKAY